MHLRHHRDRADVGRFDYKALLRQLPAPLRHAVYVLEWAYIPAIELIMQFQLLVRPFTNPAEHDRRGRVIGVLLARGALFALLTLIGGLRALALYALAWSLFLTVMHFFDAFHHTFDQYFVADDEEKVSMEGKDRDYEQANTYSNVVSVRWPWLNLLTLNFGYHNAHHQRAATPWYRLPALHRELYGDAALQLMPLSELLRWFGRNTKRLAVLVAGLVVVGAGVTMLVLPGPGLIVIILGFAILATEFAWAERALDRTTSTAAAAASTAARSTGPPALVTLNPR
jgi:fatty acid desaturase